MKLYIAELMDSSSMVRVKWTDDVNLVVFCGHGLKAFNYIAEEFNKRDERSSGGAPVRIDPEDNWEIKEVGVYVGQHNKPTILTYAVADS